MTEFTERTPEALAAMLVTLLDVEQIDQALGKRLGRRTGWGVDIHQYPAARASRSAWKFASPNISARTRARFM